VRAGIESLLTGWGAQLNVFESVGGCAAWASRCGIEEPAPDLVIIDHRLEDGHTGVEALLALRRRFGSGVPAIMVTGSTMSRVEQEAQEHQFHVLIKPVLPNKLRAMIAFKLAGRAGADQK
jgi:two-component system, sensor histidine kinase